MSRYKEVIDKEWMHVPTGGLDVACCDCGLVHKFIPKKDERGRIWLRVLRRERSTAALRRGFRFTKELDEDA